MPARCALEASHMQPQHDGMLHDGQAAEAPWSALLHAGAARLAAGTHDVIIAAAAVLRALWQVCRTPPGSQSGVLRPEG